MIEELYPRALQVIERDLRSRGIPYSEDEGDLNVAGHRLALSIHFEGFTQQDETVLAPLDIQIHLDGDEGNRFRVGSLGVGADRKTAVDAAIVEWYRLAAAPLLSALADASAGAAPAVVAGWKLFASRPGIRGDVPRQLANDATFYRALEERLHAAIRGWRAESRDEFRSLFVMATSAAGAVEVQAAMDGFVDAKLTAAVAALPWPKTRQAYVYKQLFVARRKPL